MKPIYRFCPLQGSGTLIPPDPSDRAREQVTDHDRIDFLSASVSSITPRNADNEKKPAPPRVREVKIDLSSASFGPQLAVHKNVPSGHD